MRCRGVYVLYVDLSVNNYNGRTLDLKITTQTQTTKDVSQIESKVDQVHSIGDPALSSRRLSVFES